MDRNLKDFSSEFDKNNQNNFNDNKVKLLENKILIYQKENQSLKSKIKILQEDNDDKNLKIQEQLNHLLNLENENNSLKKLYDNSKQKFNNESNSFLNAKKAQDKEINNMKMIIGELKTENEKLSKSLIIQSKENNKLQQNLMKTISENKLYSKDNTILLSKVKEYEDNIFMLNNEGELNKITNLTGQKKNEFINNVNSLYENKLALYSSIINDEINIIAKYIDTYMNLNIFDDIRINIPPLQNITNFPKDNKLSSFWNIINAVENALKRIISQNKIIKNNETILKQEINKLNNFLEKKNTENLELKKSVSDLKKNLFYLKNDYDKLNNDFNSQKGFNKQIQDTMNDINNGNDDYLKGLYKTLKNELDNIINEPLFHSYVNIMLEQKSNIKSEYNNGLKYLFGDILDKYILINNCIIDDFKKQKKQKDKGGFNLNNLDKNAASNIHRLEIIIDDLNNKLLQKDRIISDDKDEKKLLINQINILQRDIFNLKQNNINNQNEENLNESNDNIYKYYGQRQINNKEKINDKMNLNNKSNNNKMKLIENNQYNNDEVNINMNNNNINDKFQNRSDIYKNPNDINNNYNIQNEDEINDMNNEEMKDNQTENVEENELYFEGQQFPSPEGFSDINNNYNMGNYQNIQYNQGQYGTNNEQNEEGNENYNEEEEYKEEPEMEDYKNIYQFQEIIEEEENEESNKNKSIKLNNIANKDNINNIINNNFIGNEKYSRKAKSQIENMNNNINIEGELKKN